MAVSISLPLFGTPGQELEEGTSGTGKQLRDLAVELQARLERAADLLDRLHAGGWHSKVAVHDLLFTHPEVQSAEEAVKRFQESGLDAEQFVIFDEVAEDDLE